MNSRTSPFEPALKDNTAVDYWSLFRDLPEPYLVFESVEPYRIIDTNKAREKILGVSREECIGRPLLEIYPYTDERFRTTVGKNLCEQLKQVVRTGRSQQLEPWDYVVTGPDGVRRTIYLQAVYFPLRDDKGGVRYILASVREVTEEVRALEQVATIENRLNAALTIGRIGSWVFNTETKKIVGDGNFVKLFKMTKRQAENYSLDDFFRSVDAEDRSRIVMAAERSMTELVPFEEEYRVNMRDGSTRWLLARSRAEVQAGHVVFSGVVVDITERRNLQAQVESARQQGKINQRTAHMLQQRNEELEAIGRSKDEFVALASHQLRTPATAVKQYIGMVLQGYVGAINEEQADVLTKAFESNERQIQIINQILSAARADTGRLVMTPTPVEMNALMRGIIADMEASFRQREHRVVVHTPQTSIFVSADLGYLRMAIENVLSNANVYTPVGGSVTIRLTCSTKRCVLHIIDTGVGIKRADISKLFVKFSRIHNPLSVEAGGSGIGLYLTAEIVRLHGGTVEVHSQIGKGTTFAISLPLVQNKSNKGGI